MIRPDELPDCYNPEPERVWDTLTPEQKLKIFSDMSPEQKLWHETALRRLGREQMLSEEEFSKLCLEVLIEREIMTLEQMLEQIRQLTPKPETPMWHRPTGILDFFGSKQPEVKPLTPYDWAKLQSEALQLIITELIELKKNNAK